MNLALPEASRLELDLAALPLAQRAAFRRVLAVLKAQKRPFVLGGSLGVSIHVDRLIEGDLEIFLHETDAPAVAAALSAAGYKIDHELDAGLTRVTGAGMTALLHWALPAPLAGSVDDTWFERSRRVTFLDVRIRVAPLEELLWVRLATLDGEAVRDPIVEEILHAAGTRLDWQRLLLRLVGMEELVLSTLFLFLHRHHGDPSIPPQIVPALLRRMNMTAASSVSAVSSLPAS